MSSVDDRIVNMQFNNKQFTQGAAESEKSLASLESALQNAGKSQGLNQMSASIGEATSKFGALKIAGVTAVATIANKVTNMGLNLAKSLTIDPISQGFNEYNTNLKSIQTIIANTGAKLPKVTASLDKLNEYSDQTIYNFGQMAKNIGTFTAAGVDLKTSVASIQGISNIAALAGSSSEQASSAMYQLSQAIAAGRVNLQDWNSVVNAGMGGKQLQKALIRTGIAMGKVDGNTVSLGKNIKVGGQSFRDSISAAGKGAAWLTSDVLTKTLSLMDGRLSKAAIEATHLGWGTKEVNAELERQQKILKKQGFNDEAIKGMLQMADAAYQSATVVKTFPQLLEVTKESVGSVFAQAFRAILGDFNQAKKTWTAVNDVVKAQIQGIGNVIVGSLEAWNKWGGGRRTFMKSISTGFKAVAAVVGTLKQAFLDVFPPTLGSGLLDLSRGFYHLSLQLTPSKETLASLRSIFGGVFAVLHIGVAVVKGIAQAFGGFFHELFSGSAGARGGILSMVASLGETLIAFDKFITKGGKLTDVLRGVGETAGKIIGPLVTGIGLVVQAIAALVSGKGLGEFQSLFNQAKASFAEFIASIFGGLAKVTKPFGALSDFFAGLQKKLTGVSDKFSEIQTPLDKVGNTASAVGKKTEDLKNAFGSIGDKLSIFKKSGGEVEGAFSKTSEVMSVAAESGDKISSSLGRVSDASKSVTTTVTGMFETFGGTKAQAATTSTDVLAERAEESSSTWQSVGDILSKAWAVVKTVGSGIGKIFEGVGKVFSNLFGHMDALDWAATLNAIFTGALILTIRDFAKTLRDSVGFIGNFKQEFNATMESVRDTMASVQTKLKAEAIRAIAISLGILAVSLFILSKIDYADLGVGLGAIGIMMAILTKSIKALSDIGGDGEFDNKKLAIIAGSIFLISAAMVSLAIAITLLGRQDPAKVARGIGFLAAALGVMIGSLLLFSKFVKGPLKGAAVGIVLISIAMNMLASAIFAFGHMSLETLGKGLGTMAIALGVMSLSLALLSKKGKGALAAAAAIAVVSASMLALAVGIASLGAVGGKKIIKGLLTFAAALVLMTVAIGALALLGPEALMAAGAIAIVAASFFVLAKAIQAIAEVSWEGILKAGVVILFFVGVLVAIVAAIIATGGFALLILEGFAAALLLMGQAALLAGAGMALFGVGFAALVATGVAGAAFLTAAFEGFIALLPTFALQFAAAFVSFVETLAEAAPRLRKAFGTIISEFFGTIEDSIDSFQHLVQKFLLAGIETIKTVAPAFIEMGFVLIDGFLESAEKHVPNIAKNVTSLIEHFCNSISSRENVRKISTGMVTFMTNVLNGLSDTLSNESVMQPLETSANRFASTFVTAVGRWIANNAKSIITSPLKDAVTGAVGAIPGVGGVLSSGLDTLGGLFGNPRQMANTAVNFGRATAIMVRQSVDQVVAEVVRMADATVAAGSSAVAQAQRSVRAAQNAANKARGKAVAYQREAARLSKKDKRRKSLSASAKKEIRIAEAADAQADRARENVEKVKEFEAADNKGKGDLKSARAQELSNAAARMLARANAEAAEAKRIRSINRKASDALLAQSRKDAKEAQALADKAKLAYDQAHKYYELGIDERIAALEFEQAFESADAKGQADLLTKRAEMEQQKADTAAKLAKDLTEQAKALADTDQAAAMALLDQAERQAEIAKSAQDQAKADREEAASILGQGAVNNGGGGSLQPSRSVLEDAASAVDRYTASLAMAEEAAAANPTVVQFVQNNTSPVALTPSEVYRQTRNLLSAQEIKMGATLVPNN